jgi:DNA-binding SARP family transcriptional activator
MDGSDTERAFGRGPALNHRRVPAHARVTDLRLRLMRCFELTRDGRPVPLPPGARRLLAFLALHDRPLPRRSVAGTLWSDSSEQRSSGSLRTALWRLRAAECPLVEPAGECLDLAIEISVDVRRLETTFRGLARGGAELRGAELDDLTRGGELLPDWPDPWLVAERERVRQVHLQALEAATELLVERGRHREAVALGLAAVAAAPLRESAHRTLIRAHLAEGNRAEAVRQYERCAGLIRRELRLDPPPELLELVRTGVR